MRRGNGAMANTSYDKENRALHLDSIDHVAVIVRDHIICHCIYFADPDGNNIDLTTYEV